MKDANLEVPDNEESIPVNDRASISESVGQAGVQTAAVPPPVVDIVTAEQEKDSTEIASDGVGEGEENPGGTIDNWIKGMLVAVLIFIFLGLVVGIGGGVLAATGVVEVPDEVKEVFLDVWVRLPLVPKPAEYILAQAMISMMEVEELDLKLSLAFKSASLKQMLGSSDFDLLVSGPVDFSDNSNPEMALNLRTNNQIDVDIIRKGDVYFRVNQIPQLVLGMMMGMSEDDTAEVQDLLGRWVHYQKSQVDSAARASLEKQTVVNDPSESLSKKMQVLLDEKIRPLLKAEDVASDGVKAIKISVELEGQVINDLVSALSDDASSMVETRRLVDSDEILPSDVLKKVEISLWVDGQDFYIRKIEMYLLVDNTGVVERWGADGLALGVPMEKETMEMVVVAEMGNFGRASSIQIPNNYEELEEYTAEVMEVVMGKARLESERRQREYDQMSQKELEEMIQGQQNYQTENSAWGTKVLGIWTEEKD